MGMVEEKLLVLCVDKDDDLGRVGIKTPIVGYDEVLKCAIKFAISRPEDSDANALFSALNIVNKLKSEGKNCEIAVVAGDPEDDVKAGNRIREQLLTILDTYNATGVIMVSDGVDDELVIPIIQSIVPIVSIKRVVVEQLRGVEETYVLIGRYLRKIIEEPRLARIFLGVPGVLLVIIGILAHLNLLELATTITLIVIGVTMVVRGFSIDKKIEEWWESSPIIFASAVLATISLIVAIGVAIAFTGVEESSWAMLGSSLLVASPFLTFSGLSLLGGKAIVKILRRDIKVWHEVIGVLFMAFFYRILLSIAEILKKLPPVPSGEKVVEIVNSSELYFWLFLAIGVVGGLSITFSIMEKKLKLEEEKEFPIKRLALKLKAKRWRFERSEGEEEGE